MKKLLLPLFALSFLVTHAQVIPSSRTVDWTAAGCKDSVFNTTFIYNVQNYGAIPNDTIDDYPAIVAAMKAKSSKYMKQVYFPAGTYMVRSAITLTDNVVFKGASSSSTILKFDLGNTTKSCLSATRGQAELYTNITSGYTKGSTSLTLSGTTTIIAGDYAEILQDNGTWNTKPATWALTCVGQIVKVISVTGSVLTLEKPLRIDYTSSLNPRIRKIIPRKNISIQCLGIERLDHPATGGGNNIRFKYAANCSVTGVESNKSVGTHISVDASTNILVSGCYIHDAFNYDGASTRGYGINLFSRTGQCLIENSIFKHVRHAMIVKQGANGNVFSNNYSTDTYRSEFPSDASADICLHGHYAYANLFENNIVQTINVDQTYGVSGPYNTFLRNRAENYGLIISGSEYQNVVGNEITNTSFLKGNFSITGNNQFSYGNNVKGTTTPAGTSSLSDVSYYYSGTPVYWTTGTFPSIGYPNTLGSGTNPAQSHYASSTSLTSCSSYSSLRLNESAGHFKTSLVIYPNPVNFFLKIKLEGKATSDAVYKIEIINSLSQVERIYYTSNLQDFELPANDFKNGIYFLSLTGKDGARYTSLFSVLH